MSSAPLSAVRTDLTVERPNFDPPMAWSAILAGAAAAVGVSIIVAMLGAGLGFGSLSPWPGRGTSATTLGAAAVIWLIVTQWIASALGGFFAGRLRARSTDPQADEVFFRDTAHGFLAWCIGTLFTAAFLASAATTTIGAGVQVAATGAASGASAAAAQGGGDGAGYFVDTLFRGERPDPAQAGDARGEAGRILARSLTTGETPAADRTYLAQLVAARTGIAEPEAQRRVDETITRAREAADQARKAAATTSIVLALSLLVGAFIAAVAGAFGGRMRDEI